MANCILLLKQHPGTSNTKMQRAITKWILAPLGRIRSRVSNAQMVYTFVFSLMALQTISLVRIAIYSAATVDECAHIVSGLIFLKKGAYEPYRVNPPLVRAVAALPLLITDVIVPDGEFFFLADGQRNEFQLGNEFRKANHSKLHWLVPLARFPIIACCVFGTWSLFRVAQKTYGTFNGLIAATFWAFSPWTLAYGSLVTPDIPLTVAGISAAVSIKHTFQNPVWGNVIWCSLINCICVLCKMSWLVVIIGLIIQVIYLNVRRHNLQLLLKSISAVLVGIVFLQASYSFEGISKPRRQYDFHSRTMQTVFSTHGVHLLESMPLILPTQLLLGLDAQLIDQEILGSNIPNYFLGEWRSRGWYQYYVVGLVFKDTPFFLILLLIGLSSFAWLRKSAEWHILWPGFLVLCLVSQQTGFNHHLRYAIPVIPSMIIVAVRWLRPCRKHVFFVLPMCGGSILCMAMIFPRPYAYFNEVVGGAYEGWRYFGNSNLDWGQDLPTAFRWMTANPEKKPAVLAYCPQIPFPDSNEFEFEQGLTIRDSNGQFRPALAGYWIVFNYLYVTEEYYWFHDQQPIARPSPTVWIFKVRPDQIASKN